MSLPTSPSSRCRRCSPAPMTNWAAAGHLAALVLGVAVLASHRRWLLAALAINLAVTAALPVAAAFADRWRFGDNLVLARYVGRADLSRHAAEVARANGLDTLVSDSRAILADFFYTLRDSGLALYAAPVEGFPPTTTRRSTRCRRGRATCSTSARPPACRDPAVTPEQVAQLDAGTGLPHRRGPGLPGAAALLVPGRLTPRHGSARPASVSARRSGRRRRDPDLQPALLPRVAGARDAGDGAAAGRLRPLRQQGDGQPRLYLGLAGGARLQLPDPAAGPPARAGAGPIPSAARCSAAYAVLLALDAPPALVVGMFCRTAGAALLNVTLEPLHHGLRSASAS